MLGIPLVVFFHQEKKGRNSKLKAELTFKVSEHYLPRVSVQLSKVFLAGTARKMVLLITQPPA